MKKQRFKVKDNVTYKARVNCTHKNGQTDTYYFGGAEHDGFVNDMFPIY